MELVKAAESVESEVKNNGWWLRTEPNDEEYTSHTLVSEMDDEQRAKAAKLLKCSPELLEAIDDEFENIRMNVHDELADLFKRIQS